MDDDLTVLVEHLLGEVVDALEFVDVVKSLNVSFLLCFAVGARGAVGHEVLGVDGVGVNDGVQAVPGSVQARTLPQRNHEIRGCSEGVVAGIVRRDNHIYAGDVVDIVGVNERHRLAYLSRSLDIVDRD